MKRILTFLLFFIVFFNMEFVSAQSTADEIEMLLNTGAVTYGQAARFVLEASETLLTHDHSEAFDFAMQRGWVPANAAALSPARLDGVALLFMKAFDLRGGIFYSIFRNAHYAYREMVHREFIQGRVSPSMHVSGEKLLFITGRVISEFEAEL